MKQNSIKRSCLFDTKKWRWHAAYSLIDYPNIVNRVDVDHPRLGIYRVFVAVPTELYMIMESKGIKEITGFRLDNNLFVAETDQGDLNLWVYDKLPSWIYK